ncbi:MAG: hypothetical protein ACKPKO_53520, partial [Candidatus Fonsibacter sp.]
NKHPSVFINYLRVLANAKGMTFNIQHPPAPAEEETATDDQAAAAPQNNKTKVETRASSIANAKDLTQEEYDEISQRKKIGKTTTDDNLQADKHYWQNFFLTNELDESVLNKLPLRHQPAAELRGTHRRKEPRQGGQPQVREAAIQDR